MDEDGKKKKTGRKCKYETVIAPNLALIKEMYQYICHEVMGPDAMIFVF